MKVIIIGSSGYIGANLTKKLQHNDVEVYGYSSTRDNLFDSNSGILNEEFSIPPGADCIIYLSQSPYYRQLPEKLEHLWGVNVISPLKIALMAKKCGVSRIIYASTGNVYAPSFYPLSESSPVRRDDLYALSKLHAEESLANFSKEIEVISVRIFGIYGPRQSDKLVPNLIETVKNYLPVKLQAGPNDKNHGLNISLCYIDDAVEILSKIVFDIRRESRVINLAGNEVLNIQEVVDEIGILLDIAPQKEYLDEYRKLDLIANINNLIEIYNPIFTPFRNGIKKTLGIN